MFLWLCKVNKLYMLGIIMFRSLFKLCLIVFFAATTISFAQNQLDPRPYDPEIDPDIDMFMNSWQNSIPYNTHGSLTERVFFTKCDGDPLKPGKKGQVFTYLNCVAYAVLDARASTIPTTVKGEQEVFYMSSGEGTVKARVKSTEVRKGAFAVISEGFEFAITNTGDELLTIYLVSEPVPEDYEPKKEVDVNYEDEMPLRNEGYITVHWSHNGRGGISGAT